MFGDNQFALLDFICLAVSIGCIFMGFKEKKEGTLVGRKGMNEYTEESIQALAYKEGPLYVAIGILGAIASLAGGLSVLPDVIFWPAMILVLAGVVADAILIKKTLVKKDKFQNVDLRKKLK